MKISKRGTLVLGLMIVTSVIGLSFQSQALAKEKVIIYARPANGPIDVATLQTEDSDQQVALAYNSLTYYTKDGRIIPSLAESWEISPDYKDFTFHLRKGVKFHDGTTFNAHAVKFSYDRVFRVKQVTEGNYLQYATENSCEVVDDYTIKIHLKTTFPLFLMDLTSQPYGVVSPDYVKKHATADDPETLKWMTDHACGTGPFKLVEAIPGQRLVFEKFEDYWGGNIAEGGKTAPKVDKVIYQEVEDPSTARLMLEKGDVDIVEKLLTEQFDKLKTTPGIKVAKYVYPKMVYMTYDVSKPPFDDLNVRKAISHAINYDEITKEVEKGDVVRLKGLIPSGLLGHDPELAYEYDLAKAKQLMKTSSHPDGFTTNLIFASERRTEFEEVALYIQAYLKKIGIDVKIQKLAFDAQLGKQEKGEYGMALMTWACVMPDTDDTIGWLYDMARGHGGWNASFWYDEDVTKKVIKAREMTDQEQRRVIYQELNRKGFDQAIYVYLYELTKKFAMRENIKNFFYGVTNTTYFWLAEKE